jgi:tetratricopeptide (TPR) repeat protein
MRAKTVAGLIAVLFCAAVAASRTMPRKESERPSVLGRFLPARPADSRPAEAEKLMSAGRHAEAAGLLTEYLRDRPGDGDARLRLGWCHYRQGEFPAAEREFRRVLDAAPQSADARVAMGFAALQTRGGEAAAKWFEGVLAEDGGHRDALEGMVLAGRRSGVSRALAARSLDAARRLEAMSDTVRAELLPPGTEKRIRPPLPEAQPLSVKARAVKDFLEVREGDAWRPLFIRGVNVGAATPGRFAGEFPRDEALYRSWIESIASLNANAIRLYTLFPPEFYRALRAHNDRHPASRLWLIQGVWAELPPRHDFSDAAYVREFQAEIARVIDAVHGNVVLGPRGGAFGVYDVDASASTLAYIIGREWEPFAVADHNAMHAGEPDFRGRWLEVRNGRPMENRVAALCDFAASYEAGRYRVIRPLTFANWPTLDPLSHPTESSRAEEDAWRERYGVPSKAITREIWEDDAVTLDSTLIHPTAEMEAGFFAAYHIYPNFPDFMYLDPQHATARDAQGPNRYAGYLAALKEYHGTQPVLVAEFGISTSRGIAHLHPDGWHHGGLSEQEQGRIVSRMLRNIHDARYAGGVVFEFMDEWFKSTWSVAAFQSPADRRPMWFDAESPEESYGVMAWRPLSKAAIVVDGNAGDWSSVPALSER